MSAIYQNLPRRTVLLLLLAMLLTWPLGRAAAIAPAPLMAAPNSLAFSQLKITGDEFLVLKNDTVAAIPDLSQYWLEDFNNVSPLASGASNSSQQLPAVSLDAGQSLLLSSTTRDTCGAEVAGKLNVSLTDAGGFLELVQMGQNAAGAVTQTAGDVVSWSSTASGLIPNVPSSTKDPQAAYYRYAMSPTSFGWQPADVNVTSACQLSVVSGSGSTATTQSISAGSLITAPDSAPVTVINIASVDIDAGSVTASLPPSDIGLIAPEITELLPNPIGTGNDASDEFIELYNPNTTAFDLTGFSLQAGTTALHTYIFPEGSGLPAKGFTAFHSSATGLSLSNSGGQVKLLDPFGSSIGQTDIYETAADGAAWAQANGKWYWTTTITPGAANVIKQPSTAKKTSKTSTSKSKTGTPIASSKSTGKQSSSAGTTSSNDAADAAVVTPIHPWVLALVALAALLYAAYEYRTDMANYFYRCKQYLGARREARRASARR